ncbi:MAG: hypothetical protein JW780_02190 [Clostridiales bacterium]|nr:hypothetical protein [Clostridiales bacterium]
MKRKQPTYKSIITTILLISVLSFALFGCDQAAKDPGKNDPGSSSATEATSTSEEVDEPEITETTQTSETVATTVEDLPELVMTDWHVEYFPEDEYSDLVQYTFILTIESSEPIPEGARVMIDLTFENSDGEVLTGEAKYYGDFRFDGLQNFSLSVSCHNYKNEIEVLDMLTEVEEVSADFSLIMSSSSGSEDTPYASVELSAGDLSFEKDAFGIRDALLKFENKGYPEYGACVIYSEGGQEPAIIHVLEDFDDSSYLAGYTDTIVDLTKTDRIIYCVDTDITLTR